MDTTEVASLCHLPKDESRLQSVDSFTVHVPNRLELDGGCLRSLPFQQQFFFLSSRRLRDILKNLFLRQIACRVVHPGVAINILRADARTPSAEFLPGAQCATTLEQWKAVAQPGQKRVGSVTPDLAERPPFHVTEGMVCPERMGMHVALGIDISETHARARPCSPAHFEELEDVCTLLA